MILSSHHPIPDNDIDGFLLVAELSTIVKHTSRNILFRQFR